MQHISNHVFLYLCKRKHTKLWYHNKPGHRQGFCNDKIITVDLYSSSLDWTMILSYGMIEQITSQPWYHTTNFVLFNSGVSIRLFLDNQEIIPINGLKTISSSTALRHIYFIYWNEEDVHIYTNDHRDLETIK